LGRDYLFFAKIVKKIHFTSPWPPSKGELRTNIPLSPFKGGEEIN